ncbi:hypothetical protein Tco_0587977 [Tanacetum coccineum]
MSNMSEDIWYAGSDTRPPMLDRTDFESCNNETAFRLMLGKNNGENIINRLLKGPFQIGTFIQTPAEDAEETRGALSLGPDVLESYTDLSAKKKKSLLFLAGEHVTNFDDDVDDLALNVDHVFEADQCDAFDSDVDELPPHRHVHGKFLHLKKSWPSITRSTPFEELVGEYEKRAKFELTDRERKIDEQMRIIISDRNRKETSLKSELHSVQILLSSTVGHYKSKTEEVTILKKDFKQKEDKFLEEFLDIKRLKEKVEDRLYKQDQSVQTVHMLCKPKSFYDEKNKVAIGYKNPLYLTRAKQAQSALYNGHVLVTTNHTPTVVHDSEDTREIAEITRKRMMEKMKIPLCVENKVRIAPPKLLEGEPSCNLCSTKKSDPKTDILVHR